MLINAYETSDMIATEFLSFSGKNVYKAKSGLRSPISNEF